MREFFRGWLSNSQSSRRGAQPFLTHKPFKKSTKPNELTTLCPVYTTWKQSVYHFHSCISAGKNTTAKSICEIIVILFDSNFGHCNMLWGWMKTCWYEMWWYCTWNTKIFSGIIEIACFLQPDSVTSRVLRLMSFPMISTDRVGAMRLSGALLMAAFISGLFRNNCADHALSLSSLCVNGAMAMAPTS